MRLSTLLFVAIIASFLSSRAYAQTTVNYAIEGTLHLTSAPSTDPLHLDGDAVTATATLDQTMTPASSTSTTTSSSNTYNNVSGVQVVITPAGGNAATINCSSATSVTITDNVSQPDTIAINNCTVKILGITATINATTTIPDGNLSTAVPATIPPVSLTSGTVNYQIANGTPGQFSLVNAQIAATGAAPPAITPSPTAWTPGATIGSTTKLTQTVTLAASSPVSFITSTTGGSWLSVSPSEENTKSSLTITVDPTGLTQPSYSGMVVLTVQTGVTVQIPVTLTMSAPANTLSASTLSSFNYTIGTTPPASQPLMITSSPNSANVNAAVTSGGSWLSVSPGSGSTPANFTVSVNTASITTAGTLNGNIQITSAGAANSPLNVPVTLNVTASTLTVPGSTLTFNYTIGGTAPASQSVNISGTTGISFTTSTGASAWLSATPSGTVPSSITVSVSTTGLAAGTYNGTVMVTSTGATGSPAGIPVTLNVTAPTLAPSPTSLTFNYQIGSSAPAAQPITVGGTPAISFTAMAATTSGGSWLSVNPGSGTTGAGGSVSASINTAGLTTAGTFNGSITIAATGATSQVVNVTLNVTAPTLTVATSSLNFAFQIGGSTPPSQMVNVGGTAGLAFTAMAATTSGGSWLSATANGPTPNSVTISVNPGSLTANTYNGTVTIAATGATSQVINVTLTVSNSPTISPSPSSLTCNYTIGGAAPATAPIIVGGTSGLVFTATAATTSGGSWLAVDSGGTTPTSVNASVINTSQLTTAGTFKGTITFAASGVTSQVVNVTLVVADQSSITASPSSLNFTYTIGGAAPAAMALTIKGSSVLAFTAAAATTSGGSWLMVSPSSGNTPGSVNVSVITSLLTTVGTYNGTVTIASNGLTPQVVNVKVVVSTTLTLSPASLNFTAFTGGSSPANQTVNVTTGVPSPVSIATAGGAWLSATLSGGTTPAVVTVSANLGNLVAGTYSGSVVVTSTGALNSPQTIAVTFVVSPPNAITATPASVSFAYVLGGQTPAAQSVSLTSTQPLAISNTIANGSWLTVSNTSGLTPSTYTLSVNPGSLAAGTYSATINVKGVAGSNAPVTATIPVTLVVSNKPTLAASPSSLTFSAPANGSNPASQSINLSGSSALQFTLAASPSWLGVSASSSATPSMLVATVNIKGMNQGSYQGSITVTSAAAGNSPVIIPVTLNITAPLVVPGPTINAIVNGASYDSTGFSPGAIVTIFGSQLGPETGVTFGLNSRGGLDSTLGGVNVTVNGEPAIPIFVQSGQINLILPYGLPTTGQANVEVQYNNLTSPEFSIPLLPANVQIFTANASGSGPGSILNQDYSVNTATNPAAKGSYIAIFGTGGGAVNPAVTAGGIAGSTLSWVTLPYSATVNGETATVTYAGTAPGLVFGVYQFNVQLPADAPSGAVKLVVTVGDSKSQSDVTVFVK
jgi:uncharacterized protein (TIGR03437 family)